MYKRSCSLELRRCYEGTDTAPGVFSAHSLPLSLGFNAKCPRGAEQGLYS